MAIKTSDVTDSLVFFMGTTILYTVDPEFFVCRQKADGIVRERIGAAGTDEGKELVLYQEVIPKGDYYVLNPYAEGLGDRTPPTTFFYSRMKLGVTARVRMLILAVIKCVLKDKGVEAGTDLGIEVVPQTKNILHIISGRTDGHKTIVDEIDAKTYKEVETFLGTPRMRDGLVSPEYRKVQAHSIIDVALLKDESDDVPGVRKKTVQVLKALLRNIFNLHKPDDWDAYTFKAVKGAPTKMSSWMHVLYAIYEKINAAIEDTFPELTVDLGTFRAHLENMPAYYGNAYCMIIPNATPSAANSTTVPQANIPQAASIPQQASVPMQPQQQAAMSIPQQQAPQVPQGGSTLIPGVVMANGQQAPAVSLPHGGAQALATQQALQQAELLRQQYAAMMPAQQQAGYAGIPQQQIPGMMAPGMMPGMQAGMVPGMVPGMAPGMGMVPGMMPGMQQPPSPVFNPLAGGYVAPAMGGFAAGMSPVPGMPYGFR